MRYTGIEILKDSATGKRYFRGTRYPRIYPCDNDIYIITAYGDSIDVICYDYYGNVDDYWIILVANGLPGDTRFIDPGTQLRIPLDTLQIKRDFNKLNNIQ
jgi:phage tail protein X